MKPPPTLVLLLATAACIGPHIVTGAAPLTPRQTFDCMVRATTALGYTITTRQDAAGFLTAQKQDPTSPDSAEYSELSVSVYTDRDGHTQYLITPGRSRHTADGGRVTSGIMVLDVDNDAADQLARRCGTH
ncbi:MAG: hypothetical protein KGL93_09060 [Gemmatimonadota bacterium]|nr:hypothetical protein [Gemmatimonadota bacterium]HEU4988627.1 hypothetical protein [Gemmatimonadaceae bacterium]